MKISAPTPVRTITVMGATGRTGQRITQQLLAHGARVRAMGRSAHRLQALQSHGADACPGDPLDVNHLTATFSGADAVYTLLPYDVQVPGYLARQERQGQAIEQALRRSGVRHVVFLSSVGAEQISGTGLIASLHAQEQRLRGLAGCHVLCLRPGAFFDNFHASLGLIKHQGLLCDTVHPHLAVPMVATRDIATAAVQALLARDWQGMQVHELLGPRDLSHAEVAQLIGQRLGLPGLRYVQLPQAQMVQTLTEHGFAADVAALTVELSRALNEGLIRSLAGRPPAAATAATATRFEDFCGELADAFETA